MRLSSDKKLRPLSAYVTPITDRDAVEAIGNDPEGDFIAVMVTIVVTDDEGGLFQVVPNDIWAFEPGQTNNEVWTALEALASGPSEVPFRSLPDFVTNEYISDDPRYIWDDLPLHSLISPR